MEPVLERQILVVANRTAATPELLATVKRYAQQQPTRFALMIPDVAEGEHTDWTFELALPLLERAAGSRVAGLTGEDADPFDAVSNALSEAAYDLVIISTLPRHVSKWLRRDLPRRVEALGVAVDVVTPPRRGGLRAIFEDAERSGLPPAGMGGV
jgi:hypothetical protein